ncbi:hypothetical protein C9422_23640 [Pseudomonas sp. B1(2018)]|nr:hypothetical protein C9422_23640 [Pseudomonas sp. B1(2018)]
MEHGYILSNRRCGHFSLREQARSHIGTRSTVGAGLLAKRPELSPQIPQSFRNSPVSRCFSTRSASRSISRSRKA